MRWLADYSEYSFETLIRFGQFKLEKLFEHIQSQGVYNPYSYYLMCRDIVSVLNWTSHKQLLARPIRFRNPIANPDKQRMDVTTKAFAAHREKNFPDSAFIDAVSAIKQKTDCKPRT